MVQYLHNFRILKSACFSHEITIFHAYHPPFFSGFRSGQAQPGPARSSPGAFPAMHVVRGAQLGALRAAARQLVGKVQLRGFTWKNVAREHGNMAQ